MNELATSLSWQTLLTVACGYAAYFVANVGVREHHKTIDVAFSTAVFGFLATFFYQLMLALGVNLLVATIGTFLVAASFGGLWAVLGRQYLDKALRRTGVSHNDDYPSAFDRLITETKVTTTQLSVRLKDGTWLLSENLHECRDLPNGPCVLGRQGDVLMYITHVRKPGQEYEPCDLEGSKEWGHEISYIPADQIARIDLRQKQKR